MITVRPNWLALDRLRVLFITQDAMDYLERELASLDPNLVYKNVINGHEVSVITIFGRIILKPDELIVTVTS